MKRTLATGFGLLEILAPKWIVGTGERLAFENPGDGQLREWTLPIARLEGLVFIWLVNREGPPPKWLRPALIAFGAVMALAPRTILEWGLEVSYENADDLEVKSWVVPVTRVLGAGYLVLGLVPRRAAASTNE